MPDVRISGPNGVINRRNGGVGESGNEIERLRAEVTRSRDRLGSSLAELERRVAVTASWRHWVRANPLATVALGVCAGYLVGRWRARPERSA
jgi:ElaB/YqjD/DUF883 family membrane-anchored ribosome-binding protein